MPIPVRLLRASEDELRACVRAWFAERGGAEGYNHAEVWHGIGGTTYPPLLHVAVDAPPDPLRVALDALVVEGVLRVGYHPTTNAPHWIYVG